MFVVVGVAEEQPWCSKDQEVEIDEPEVLRGAFCAEGLPSKAYCCIAWANSQVGYCIQNYMTMAVQQCQTLVPPVYIEACLADAKYRADLECQSHIYEWTNYCLNN